MYAEWFKNMPIIVTIGKDIYVNGYLHRRASNVRSR